MQAEFDSPGAGILTNRAGKYRKDVLLHRTDERASVEKLPEGEWLYEIKHDGYRALAFKDGKDVRLVSRNKKAYDYPQLLEALKLLPTDRVTLDGEVVALDEKGRSFVPAPPAIQKFR